MLERSSDRTSTVRGFIRAENCSLARPIFTQASFDKFLELPAVLKPGGLQHSNVKNWRVTEVCDLEATFVVVYDDSPGLRSLAIFTLGCCFTPAS